MSYFFPTGQPLSGVSFYGRLMVLTDAAADWIDLSQFQNALAAAKLYPPLLKAKYPHLQAYLVLSSPTGQTEADNELAKMVADFPGLVIDNPAKADFRKSIKKLDRLDEAKRSNKLSTEEADKFEQTRARWVEKIRKTSRHLVFDGNCQFELRFRELNYDLIVMLKADKLVDRHLTPQTKASIRIVLATVSRFSRVDSD